MPVNSDGTYQYPQNGWSTGRMRRRGQRPDNPNGNGDGRIQLAMDVRRGRPELEEPGIAEAEKLAGAGLGARGGATQADRERVISGVRGMMGADGLSPETIASHKSQIIAMTNQWVNANVDWRRWQKKVKDLGWDAALELNPVGGSLPFMALKGAIKAGKDYTAEYAGQAVLNYAQRRMSPERFKQLQEDVANAPGNSTLQKVFNVTKKMKKDKLSITVTDPNGQMHDISLTGEK